MNILYLLVPLALALAGAAAVAFRWAAHADQFDDLESPAIRMLADDETLGPPDESVEDPRESAQ